MILTCNNNKKITLSVHEVNMFYLYSDKGISIHIYFPFKFSERDSFIKSECGYQRGKGNIPVIVNGWDCQTLAFINPLDMVTYNCSWKYSSYW